MLNKRTIVAFATAIALTTALPSWPPLPLVLTST